MKTIKYTGNERGWDELAFTGKQSVWYPGQVETREDVEAAQLQATGFFVDAGPADLSLTSAGLRKGGAALTSGEMQAVRGFVSVKDFGAIGDGVTDDSTAFALAVAYANSVSVPASVLNSNRSGRVKLYVPAGRYRLTQPIIRSTDFSSGRTAGFALVGDGPYMTEILYEPAGTDPLFYNNDKLLFLRISGLLFYANAPSVELMYSTSSGGGQDYRFDDCVFAGVWSYGLRLKGSNTNSEVSFEKCSYFGTWTAFLFGEDSDQFLNYWFTECKYWCSSMWMKMTKGGNIKISNCDVSGYQPSVETYLFRLEGASHSNGMCSFVCHATRFELKNTNAKIIYSEWPQGNILFSGADTESQSSAVAAFNTALFSFINVPGPVIQWINCSLMGTHTYASSGSSQFNQIPRISYDNCFITQFAKPEEFLIRTHGTNYGGRPVARFYNSRGNGAAGTYEVFDSDQGWADAARAVTTRKIARVGSSNDSGPQAGATQAVRLPLNSVITKVWLFNPAGSTANSGAYNFVIRTNEGSPTVFGTASGGNLSLGFSVTADLTFFCDSETKRTINVVDLQTITNIGKCFFLIEYIG